MSSSSSYLPVSSSPSSPSVGFSRTRLASKRNRRIALGSTLLLVVGYVVYRCVTTIRAVSPYHRANLAHIYAPSWVADLTFPLSPPSYFLDDYHEITHLANPPLASYSCPALHGPLAISALTTDNERRDNIVNPLVMLATFSVASNSETRAMLRQHRRIGLLPQDDRLVETVFVLGALRTDGQDGDELAREQTEARLKQEQETYGDLIRLEMEENMDEGKSYDFFKQVVRRAESTGPSPQFVIKTDEDTIVNLPNLLKSLASLDCNEGVYWGTSVGSCISGCFPRYFQGMAYGLSYPLLAHLAHSNLEHGHSRGTEDARTGSWMGAVDERTRLGEIAGEGPGKRVRWAEVGGLLGGEEFWFAKSPKWIGKHPYKDHKSWLSKWSAELTIWAKLGKPYVWLGGDEVARRP